MKKIIFIVLLLFASVLLVSCNSFHSSVYSDAEKYEAGSKEFDGVVEKLDIDWLSGEISLIQDKTLTKTIVTEETEDLSEDEQVHTYLEEGTLHIRFCKSGYSGSYGIFDQRKKKHLTVKFADLKDLDLMLTSGNANIADLEVTNVSLTLTSGDVEFNNLKADKVDATYTSGNLAINNLVANLLDVNYTSGNLEIASAKVLIIKMNITSGSAALNLVETPNVEIDMTSGNVELAIPNEKGVKLILDKTSGSLKTQKTFTRIDNEYIFGLMDKNIEMVIKVDMTSGTLNIK